MLKQQYDSIYELILTVANSFCMSHADAEKYARAIKDKALDEYRKVFRK